MRSGAIVFFALGLISHEARGDVVVLKGGSTFEGVAKVQGDEVIVRLETGGEVTFPKGDVARIETNDALAQFGLRAKKVRAGDVAGLKALARWAKSKNLESKSQETYRRVLALDPKDAEARKATGASIDTQKPKAVPTSSNAARNDACTEVCVRRTIGRQLVQSGTDSMGRPIYAQRSVGGVGTPEYNACVAQCRRAR